MPWNNRLGASPVDGEGPNAAPDNATAARTPEAGCSPVSKPTFIATIAPADEPPIAMRVGSMWYCTAFVLEVAHGGLRIGH